MSYNSRQITIIYCSHYSIRRPSDNICNLHPTKTIYQIRVIVLSQIPPQQTDGTRTISTSVLNWLICKSQFPKEVRTVATPALVYKTLLSNLLYVKEQREKLFDLKIIHESNLFSLFFTFTFTFSNDVRENYNFRRFEHSIPFQQK